VVPDIIPDDGTLTPREKLEILIPIANRGNRTARRTRVCVKLSDKLRRSGEACRVIARLPSGHSLVLRVRAIVRSNACRGNLRHEISVKLPGVPLRKAVALARLLAGPCGNAPCPAVATRAPSMRAPFGPTIGARDPDRGSPVARISC
jgi:hypothetical protein